MKFVVALLCLFVVSPVFAKSHYMTQPWLYRTGSGGKELMFCSAQVSTIEALPSEEAALGSFDAWVDQNKDNPQSNASKPAYVEMVRATIAVYFAHGHELALRTCVSHLQGNRT